MRPAKRTNRREHQRCDRSGDTFQQVSSTFNMFDPARLRTSSAGNGARRREKHDGHAAIKTEAAASGVKTVWTFSGTLQTFC
jgi:hypothetical protein